ncbi:MAG TPA: SUMF1/EgtB/PvdO family nonheme iron enzyme [Blastocatellia bacterium]|nr:SUMF1/EgtB/PvdO family nonheme iron enzyme [Blastocatellia bacterium]
MYCERCNIDFPESLRYCKWCGQHLIRRAQATSHIRRCQNCGHAVKSAWSYCRSCGTQLVTTVPQPDVFCAGCGNLVEPPGLICKVCGLEVQQESEPDADLVAALYSEPSSYAYCASCGVRLDPQSNRCTKCGLPVTRRHLVTDALQTCPICKTQNRRGTGICSGCGAALSADSGTASDLMPRAPGGPPTLPDAPLAASQESASGGAQPQHHVDTGQSKAPDAGAGISTVSYTEILSSWTPAEAAAEHPPLTGGAAPSGPSRADGQAGERGLAAGQVHANHPDIKTDEFKADELKTNAMPALDLSAADLLPTEALPTGPLPGARSTSVFEPNDLPVDALRAPAPAPEAGGDQDYHPEGHTPAQADFSGVSDAFAADDNWVVTSHEFAESHDVPVHPPETNAGLPGGLIASRDNGGHDQTEPPAVVIQPRDSIAKPEIGGTRPTSERAGSDSQLPSPVSVPGVLSPSTASPPPLASTGSGAQMPPDPEAAGARSRQVPPEVAHYMAYMDRQSAPHAPPQIPPPQSRQPGQAKKSSMLPILLAIGALAIIILAGLGFLIFRFQQRQKQNLARTATPEPSISVDIPAAATPQPEATPTVQEVVTPEGMVVVSAGTYIIGRDDGDKLAGPKHTETLASFFIDKTETTNAQYKRFVDVTGHTAPATWREKVFAEGKENYPVTDVTWQDASDYAAWAGKRLPSEAEWEAAARGTEGRAYPWGNEWRSDAANIGTGGIVEVGKFPEGAAASGALDMIGNVWEWTADEFRLYPGNITSLRDLVEPGVTYRVIRGGAYDGSKKNDASYRGYLDANKPYPKTGFRCVKSANRY